MSMPEGSAAPEGTTTPDGSGGMLADPMGRLTETLGRPAVAFGGRVGRFREGAGEAPPPQATIATASAVTRPIPARKRRACMRLPRLTVEGPHLSRGRPSGVRGEP